MERKTKKVRLLQSEEIIERKKEKRRDERDI
jgi:hypothetical protein